MAHVASEKSLILPPSESLGEVSRCKDKLGGRMCEGWVRSWKNNCSYFGVSNVSIASKIT
jgi:hypothetical protein